MEEIFKDSRFTKLINDPKYRQIPKAERKVKIDKRFQSMFDSEKFKVKYTVDKRGRPVNQSSSENLKKYYDLSSEEDGNRDDESSIDETEEPTDKLVAGQFVRRLSSSDNESQESEEEIVNDEEIATSELKRGKLPTEIKKKLRNLEVDYARGEGVLLSDSSSEEEDSDEENDDTEHGWGELDADAECTENATNRLAVCNMDWDNIKASDLFVLFNSFVLAGGLLKSVTIYPSEFGLKRMKEEDLRGPIELTETKKNEVKEDNSKNEETEEGSKYHMEKLRQYQLNRLKYYYAVVVCDTASTADKIYNDCDGVEYESSSAKLDLRFVPDDISFDQEIHEECLQAPDVDHYKPRLFTTTALQQAKVELTWDAANPHRTEVLRGAAGGDIKDEDLKNYLAYSSTESESDDEAKETMSNDENDDTTVDPIAKYKALLQDIENTETKKKNKEMEMEITWGLGLKEKTEELVKRKMTHGSEKLTPFEELVEKRKDKKKAKKLERKNKIAKEKNSLDNDDDCNSAEDIPSDVDMNDPYFAEEFDNKEFKKKSKKKSKKHIDSDDNSEVDEESQRKMAELELLLDDNDEGKQHFSLKKIQNAENETKSKRKRKLKEKMKRSAEDKAALPDFEVDVNDSRFSALFTSHHYNIDPTDPNYKKTKAMDALIQEKLKRRPTEVDLDVKEHNNSKKPKHNAAMNVLIKSIKRKSQKRDD